MMVADFPIFNGLIRLDPPPLEVVIEVDTSRFDAAMATVDASIRRIEQAQAFARWSLANDPTRLWHERCRWFR